MFADGGADAIWSSYIRYIGAGALAAGGIISPIKSLPLIIKTFGGAMKSLKVKGENSQERTSHVPPHVPMKQKALRSGCAQARTRKEVADATALSARIPFCGILSSFL